MISKLYDRAFDLPAEQFANIPIFTFGILLDLVITLWELLKNSLTPKPIGNLATSLVGRSFSEFVMTSKNS